MERWKKNFSLTIFFSETAAPSRNGPESLESAPRAPYAHIFCVQIGPIENRTWVIGKTSSRPLRPYFFCPDRTNRSRFITHLGEPDLGKKHFSLTIFFSETIAPRRTGPGSLERPRRALYAHIFCEPIYNGLKGTKEKNFSLTIFFSETAAPSRTGPESLESVPRAPCALIFCVQIGPIENRTLIIGKDTSRPLRPYFLRTDRTNRSRVITENRNRVSGKGPSRPLRPYFLRTDRTNRSRVITEHQAGVIGKGPSRPLRPYFLRTDRTNRSRNLGEPDWGRLKGLDAHSTPIFLRTDGTYRSRVITRLAEPSGGHWKVLVASSTHIFFTTYENRTLIIGKGSSRPLRTYFCVQIEPIGADTYENRAGVIGKDSSRPLRPHFFCLDRTDRSRAITENRTLIIGKDTSRPLRPYFLDTDRTNRSRENRNRVSGKGPSRPLRPYFLRTDRTNRSRVITHLEEPDRGRLKGSSHPLRPYFLRTDRTNRSRVITENRNLIIGKDSSRHLRPYIFSPDRTNRSRALTHVREPEQVPRRTGPETFERARRFLYAHIFDVQIGPEPSYNGLKGTKEKKFFLTIFFSGTIAPRRTRPRSLERARRALYAHIFFVQMEPIGAESDQQEPSYNGLQGTKEKKNYSLTIFFLRNCSTYENRTLIIGKDTSRPLRPHFFRPDRTNRSRAIIHLGEPDRGRLKGSSRPLRPYFLRTDRTNRSRVITEHQAGVIGKGPSRPLRPYFLRTDRTNRSRVITNLGEPDWGRLKGLDAHSTPIFLRTDGTYRSRVITRLAEPSEGHWKALVASSTHIFFTTYENRTLIIGKGSSRPLRTYFCVQIEPIGADTYENRAGVIGKDSSRPLRPHFFCLDRTDRSRAITENRTLIIGKDTSRPLRPYFLDTDRTNRSRENRNRVSGKGPSRPLRPYFLRTDRTNRSRVITHLEEPDRGRLKGSSHPLRPYFLRTDRTNRSRVITENRNLIIGKDSSRHLRPYIFSPGRTNRGRAITHVREPEQVPRRTGPETFERARRFLYAHIFYVQIGPIGADTYENRTLIIGKDSSSPLRPHFFRPYRTNRSRAITHLGEPDLDHWKGLVAPSTLIFSSTRSDQNTYENRTRVTGKGSSRPLRPYFFRTGWTNRSRVITVYRKKKFFFNKFFSETIAPRRTGPGSFERAHRALYAHIFLVQTGPIGAEIFLSQTIAPRRTGPGSIFLSETIVPRRTERGIFLSETIVPRRTERGSLERARRALYAHIFFDQIGPKVAEKNIGKKHFSLTIFFSETVARTRTGAGYLERARRALYAHIFCVQIGPIGAEIFLSETIAPRRTGPWLFERARRALYGHIFCVPVGPIGAERTRLVSLESARRALYAHIFFDQIGPKVADTYENRTRVTGKGSSRPLRPYFFRPDRTNRSRVITHLGEPDWGNKGKKNFSLTIFFSETIAPTRTGPGSLERALRGLYAHIFFVQIGPIGAEIFLSETVVPRRTERGSLERARRALYAHIFCVRIGPIGANTYENRSRVSGKGSLRPLRPYFLRRDRPNRSRVITFKDNKGKKHFSLTIFFSETISPRRTGPGSFQSARRALYAHIFCVQVRPIGAETYENRSRVPGKGSSRPLHSYFLRPDRTKSSRVITNIGKKHFSLTIFFSETVARTRTGAGYLERARRALYAHIFFVQIGPNNIGKKHFSLTIFFSETVARTRTGAGYLERARCALYAHIFCVQIGPIGAEIFLSETIAPRRTGPGSFERARRALYAHIFLVQIGPIGDERTGPGSFERARRALYGHIFCVQVGPIGAEKNIGKKHFSLTIFFSETVARTRTGAGYLERARRALYAHIFCVHIGPIGAEIFLSETIAPRRTGPWSFERARRALYAHIFFVQIGPIFKDNKGKKHFSLRIFLSETIAPRRTGAGSFERARRALYAHIFLVQIGPIGADTYENRSRVPGNGSSRPLRPYFLRTDWTNRSRVITHLGEPDRGRPRRTGPGSFQRARRALYAHIFCVQVRPIGAELKRFTGNKGKKTFSLTIFFSGTKAPRRTRLVSLESARRALYAHIFCVHVRPIGADTYENRTQVTGKGSSRPLRSYFLRPDRTNRSQENRTGVVGKGSSRPLRPYFSRTGWTNRSRVITHPGEPDRGRLKELVASSTPIFSSTRSHLGEPDRGRLKELVAPSTPIFSSTRSHLGEPYWGRWKGLVAPSTLIFFSSRLDQ
ncbi:LOW QUALITY PROTEIN: hypothetical protein V1477_006447 [Vespula maculifrons]|uniref:Uncharacterized protein n=1 Tax=Vespula maculifrons TaxID=7453 RepID=A0ABD2CJN5_VESMC